MNQHMKEIKIACQANLPKTILSFHSFVLTGSCNFGWILKQAKTIFIMHPLQLTVLPKRAAFHPKEKIPGLLELNQLENLPAPVIKLEYFSYSLNPTQSLLGCIIGFLKFNLIFFNTSQ